LASCRYKPILWPFSRTLWTLRNLLGEYLFWSQMHFHAFIFTNFEVITLAPKWRPSLRPVEWLYPRPFGGNNFTFPPFCLSFDPHYQLLLYFSISRKTNSTFLPRGWLAFAWIAGWSWPDRIYCAGHILIRSSSRVTFLIRSSWLDTSISANHETVWPVTHDP